MAKKDIEIQPGFEPGFLNSSQILLPTEPLELWHWSRGQKTLIHGHSLIHRLDLLRLGYLCMISTEALCTVTGELCSSSSHSVCDVRTAIYRGRRETFYLLKKSHKSALCGFYVILWSSIVFCLLTIYQALIPLYRNPHQRATEPLKKRGYGMPSSALFRAEGLIQSQNKNLEKITPQVERKKTK